MRPPNKFAAAMFTPLFNPHPAWWSELKTQERAIFRDCPRSRVINRDHALQRVAGVMVAGDGAIMARRYLIRGLLADGYLQSEVADALRASADELARATSELEIHKPGARKLEELYARVPRRPSYAEGYDVSEDRRSHREGDLFRGSRGWRTPANAFPQTRTDLLDGRNAVPYTPPRS